ncbi:MAG: tetratricopeptide repeat protein [Myxococcales bacterium]|nr:tetratricopeptide repeat protein [Myxococcales bacterium]
MKDAYTQLERLLDVGRLHDAEQLLQRELSADPADPQLCVYAARVAVGRDDPEEARRQVALALAADPTHFTARALLHDLEEEAGNYAEAELLIVDLIGEDPDNGALLATYAQLMLRTFHLEKARALVNEALRRDPDDETARLVDVLLATVEGDRARAGVQLADLIADNPEGRRVAWMLFIALVEQARHREALAIGQQLLRDEPDDQELIDHLITLRAATHPLALPLWPMSKFGWAASAAIWGGAVVLMTLMRHTKSPWVAALGVLYLVWVIYTWVYPPMMTRWLRHRGLG